MAEQQAQRMTMEEFLAWDPGDDLHYELVDGMPRTMTGARSVHDDDVVSTIAALVVRLRGKPCRPFTADIGIRIPNGSLRRPDVSIERGDRKPEDMVAKATVMVVEVLSPSTRHTDMLRKTLDYRSVASLRYILLLEAEETTAILHVRDSDGAWAEPVPLAADAVLDLPALDIALPSADFYPART